MKGGSPRTRGTAGWRRVEMDRSVVGGMLRDAGFALGEGEPVQAYGHVDREGRPRRIHARYGDGWRVTLVLRLDGSKSLSFALSLRQAPREAA